MRTIFSDEVVQATELKRNQRHWFERARETGGVTIVQGGRADLVLALRQQVASDTETAQRTQLVSQFLLEWMRAESNLRESIVFPWLRDLDDEERRAFARDLIEAFADAVARRHWAVFDETLEDWQATAEANRTHGLLLAWQERGRGEDYETMEAPGAAGV